ncbi:MAG: LytR/AlgR family response regulator transcription factor [Candidatus Omnitrophota bacterium]
MIRVLIADDEPMACKRLEKEILKHPGFEVIGQASGGTEALEKVTRERPEVLFLDIEMPGKTGLEVAAELSARPEAPLIVFVTAYNQYAIEAFEKNAVDYILKPFEEGRIAKTLERIEKRLAKKEESRESLLGLIQELVDKKSLKKIVAFRRKSRDRIIVDPADIFYFSIKYSETLVRVQDEEMLVRSTFKDLTEFLDPEKFVLVHREYIANVDKIKKVSPAFHGNYEIHFSHPENLKIPLSKRYVKALNHCLKGI